MPHRAGMSQPLGSEGQNGKQSWMPKHCRQMPAHPGQLKPGGAWLTLHSPEAVQVPVMVALWQRSTL